MKRVSMNPADGGVESSENEEQQVTPIATYNHYYNLLLFYSFIFDFYLKFIILPFQLSSLSFFFFFLFFSFFFFFLYLF